ncbi:GlxA family transcriptional regulator [Aminobacter sp. AP02]|uniref:GlxA family transcriptional regulator n=1 Tax=Aminobacter sp. AP02 TaxID=2135737 RepID=UPI000D6DB442|nr:GlxA family transcriptional regulator [Aminobacter sp. AP02]PWK76980.1 transcriptional regulator GlxA family with amidase domain [Aminobacter sp. AP02]
MNAPSKHTVFNIGACWSGARAAQPRQPLPQVSAEFSILLLQGFSQLCLSSLVEPLRVANALAGTELFRWKLVSLDGCSVASASGISVEVSGSCAEAAKTLPFEPQAAMAICAGEGVERHGSHELRACLRRLARAQLPVYALGTATWLLADAGLLGDIRCTIHWGKMAALSESFYDLAIDDALFVRDGQIVTCAGELAAFDLAIDIVQERCGTELARSICQHVTADRWRDGASCQSVPPGLRYGSTGKKLLRILQLMEKNIEDPLSLEEISSKVSLSRRQIERLFERHLSTTPWQHYLTLRLVKARQLIEATAMPIMDVAVACGFVSSSHFSKSFRDHFKVLPSKLRSAGA